MLLDWEQLAVNGYCTADVAETGDDIQGSAEIFRSWFSGVSQEEKLRTTSSAVDNQAGTGRGYLSLPAKELIEVSYPWKGFPLRADLRLAVKTAYSMLQQIGIETLRTVLKHSNGFKLTAPQLVELLGQQKPGNDQQCSINSLLHINSYRTPADAAAMAGSSWNALQGCEAHIDKGLLTVIYATAPGLQVLGRDGSWIPVNPAPGQLVILVGHTLSYMTAGRLPAAMHRVVVPGTAEVAAARNSNDSSSRLSLCFKLHAAPDAVLSPAKVTGTKADLLQERFRTPKTTQQLIAEFDATHTSIHSQPRNTQQQQQQQQQGPGIPPSPAPPATAAAAMTGPAAGSTKRPGHMCEPQQKRQCLPPKAASNQGVIVQQAPQDLQRLTIIIMSQDGSEVRFQVKPTTKMGVVMQVYVNYRGLDGEGYRFLFDGERIDPEATAEDLCLEDGDTIDFTIDQLGD